MILPMAPEITAPPESPQIFKLQTIGRGVRRNDARVKVYQVRVVRTCALSGAYSMCVVACRTRTPLSTNMFMVLAKTRIAVDIGTTVALIA